MKKHLSIGIFFLLLLISCSYAHAAVYYVNDDAAGSNTGEGWTNAFTDLQDALTASSSGDEIWVAAGTYYPSEEHGGSGDRRRSFQMINGVSIYGGFNGTETAVDQREIQGNPAILSGDVGVAGDASDNCYHVFYHPSGLNLDETAQLDGFIITDGNANGSEGDNYYGGGMLNYSSSSPTLTDCTFSGNTADYGGGMFNFSYSSPALTDCTFNGNTADWGGGGIYNYSSSPTLTNCTFDGNTAYVEGGGMFNFSYSSPMLTDCTFTGNTASSSGGGMSNHSSSSPTLTNCTFNGNTAGYGGGMDNYSSSSPILKACTFSGNRADYGGGMDNYYSSSPTLMNCTFSGNTADDGGGGMYNSYSSPMLTNCILWGDTPYEIYNYGSELSISYCNIQGSGGSGSSWNGNFGTDGGGNSDEDPLFMGNPGPGDDTVWGTADDDYGDLHLTVISPCIDRGDPSASGDTDMDGEPRIIDGDGDEQAVIDMGADEFLDTDQDGLSDTWEEDNGLDPYDTDSDDDGMPDGFEISYFGNNDRNGNEDYDDDGFTDLQEFLKGTDPTDPESHPPRAMPWLQLLFE